MRLEDLFGMGETHAGSGEGSSKAFTGRGGPGAGFALDWCFRIGLGGEGAVAEFVAGGVLCSSKTGFFSEAGFGEAHQLIENCEFKFELDGVDHRFYGGFPDVVVGEFQADEDDVHADTYAIDT